MKEYIKPKMKIHVISKTGYRLLQSSEKKMPVDPNQSGDGEVL
jgi:hypothetical protein